MIARPWMSHERQPGYDAVEALLAAGARVTGEPTLSPVTRHPGKVWTLGYVDATGMQRNSDLDAQSARIREYAERHQLTLIYTYVDRPGENGLGFRSLLASIERNPPQLVLVTSLAHLNSPVIVDGEPIGDTKHERLARLRVDVQEIFP